ncbi:hypothetical protein EV127DRAFT_184160 [Xylaria flabelliformis]|nr:hypothetical protein EV127DRAFT_184160 [Xylaria flabelliformis]
MTSKLPRRSPGQDGPLPSLYAPKPYGNRDNARTMPKISRPFNFDSMTGYESSQQQKNETNNRHYPDEPTQLPTGRMLLGWPTATYLAECGLILESPHLVEVWGSFYLDKKSRAHVFSRRMKTTNLALKQYRLGGQFIKHDRINYIPFFKNRSELEVQQICRIILLLPETLRPNIWTESFEDFEGRISSTHTQGPCTLYQPRPIPEETEYPAPSHQFLTSNLPPMRMLSPGI